MKAADHPLLTKKILSLFHAGLEQGRFDFFDEPEDVPAPDSVLVFLQLVLSQAGKPPEEGVISYQVVSGLDSLTLAQLLDLPCSEGAKKGRLRVLALAWLTGLVPKFITMSTMHTSGEAQQYLQLKAEARGKFDQLSDDQEFRMEIGAILFDALIRTNGSRNIRSFFVGEPNKSGFLGWCPTSFSNAGTPLKLASIPVDSGVVSVKVHRYQNEMQLPIHAYEWMAELRMNSASTEPDAVACGMFYVSDTEDGFSVAEPNDLILAADEVADVDVLQVKAFLEQHQDAEDLLLRSDICFVWLWDRRKGARKGAGRDCLIAALKNLKKRFKRLGIVVFDLQPAQFLSLRPNFDPAEIQVERAEAIERLAEYVEGLKAGDAIGGTSRIIFNHDGDDTDAALDAVRSTY